MSLVPPQLQKNHAWVKYTLEDAIQNGWEAFIVNAILKDRETGEVEQKCLKMPASTLYKEVHIYKGSVSPYCPWGTEISFKDAMSLARARKGRHPSWDRFEAAFVPASPPSMTTTQAEKAAAKAAKEVEKAAKFAAKEEWKAMKAAEKEAEKAAKFAAKEEWKAMKAAEKAAEKAERAAVMEAKKAERAAAKKILDDEKARTAIAKLIERDRKKAAAAAAEREKDEHIASLEAKVKALEAQLEFNSIPRIHIITAPKPKPDTAAVSLLELEDFFGAPSDSDIGNLPEFVHDAE
jgi:hypothetical protein